jgi:hypothetical protein
MEKSSEGQGKWKLTYTTNRLLGSLLQNIPCEEVSGNAAAETSPQSGASKRGIGQYAYPKRR